MLEGATVRLKDADDYDETILAGADGTFSFADVPFGNYNLTVEMDGYTGYSEKIAFDGNRTADITLDWDFANTISGNVDLSGMNDENHTIVIDAFGAMAQLTLDETTAAGDTIALYVTLRANRVSGAWNDNFGVILAEKDGTYYGLSFLYENLSNPSADSYVKQQWTNENALVGIPAWATAALAGDGLETLFVRNGTTIDLLAKNNGVWTYLCSTSVPDDAVTDVRFQQWGSCTYSGIEWTNDIGIEPVITAGENGEVTAQPVNYGEDLVVTIAPADNYMIGSRTGAASRRRYPSRSYPNRRLTSRSASASRRVRIRRPSPMVRRCG